MSRRTKLSGELLSQLQQCEQRIGYTFRDKDLLQAALTHASGAENRLLSNERLEFLGDAILGAVACQLLFYQYPHCLEGELTRMKSMVVSRQTCAKLSESLGMQEFMILGKGMANHTKVPTSLLAGVFESLVAAIYLDGGYEAAREFLCRHLEPEVVLAGQESAEGNFKSLLQQWAQREHGTTPTYLVLEEKGPDHNKCFKISAQVSGVCYPPAWGRNKKEAEQRAAQNALAVIGGQRSHSQEN